MVEYMKFTKGVLQWDVSFFRTTHDRELEALLDFMATIYGSSVRGIGEDKICWKLDRNKGFIVSAYYHILVGCDLLFPWKSIWKQKISSQVAFFIWTAVWGECLMIDNLRKRRVWVMDWCYMCKSNGESVDHLFLHCPVAMELGLWFWVYLE